MSYRFVDSFRAGSGWRSILILLESCLQTCMTYTIAECTANKLLMTDRGTVRNVQSFMPKQICEIGASSWFYYKEICCDARSRERETLVFLFDWGLSVAAEFLWTFRFAKLIAEKGGN